VRAALEQAKARALEIIGGKIESYAKGLVPVDTGALRNSITHAVDGDTVLAGSAILYAPYVELGTGKEYSPPPEWMENNAQRGAGIISRSVKPRPYLRPAVIDHVDEYKNVVENELKNA
jgi:phage gpG-like protein